MEQKISQETMKKNLQTRLTQLMYEKNETQTIVSLDTGVSRQNLAKYVSGKAIPNSYTLYKLATHFGVTCDYLLGKDDGKTYDKNYIITETGLNETAIRTLKKLINSNNINRYNFLFAINQLLDNEESFNFLLSFTRYIATPDIDSITKRDKYFSNLYWRYHALYPGNTQKDDAFMKIEDIVYSQLMRDFNNILNILKQNIKTSKNYIADIERNGFENYDQKPKTVSNNVVREVMSEIISGKKYPRPIISK